MSEQTVIAPARKVRARTKRKAAKVAAQRAPAAAEFEGLTDDACCTGCGMERCVITGKPLCGHPRKGGLQPPDMLIPTTFARFQRAVKHLKHAEAERSDA